MLRGFTRLSLGVQWTILMIVLGSALVLALWSVQRHIVESVALQRGRTLASIAQALSDWATEHRGVWVRTEASNANHQVGDFLEHRVMVRAPQEKGGVSAVTRQDVATLAALSTGAYHSKNPALVVRELSQLRETTQRQGERFRLTSDRLFNPANAPDRFESAALELFRTSSRAEHHEITAGHLRYARRLVASEGCMACHGAPERSPATLRAKYANTTGWGYRPGDVVGVVSASVPLVSVASAADATGSDSLLLSPKIGLAVGAVSPVMLLLWLWVRWQVIGATQRLARHAASVKTARRGAVLDSISLDVDELTSHNEAHRLSHDLKAVARALSMAQATGPFAHSRPAPGER
jgi:hypothetical protein